MPIINSKVGFVDAVDPDLRQVQGARRQAVLYAGWGDTTITPENTVLYYESVLNKMGKNQGDLMRLFMVPGMAHCRGGDGPDTFDTIGTLEAWREKGVAPAQLTAANTGVACRVRCAPIRSTRSTRAPATSRTPRTGPAPHRRTEDRRQKEGGGRWAASSFFLLPRTVVLERH